MEPVILRQADPDDTRWLVEQHAFLYARDEGFDESFGVLVERVVTEFFANQDPACERGLIAARGKKRLGSIFCTLGATPKEARLRLFLVMPDMRRRGLGQRLLNAHLSFAAEAGFDRVRLWTHQTHRAACALYAKNGFAQTASKPVTSFGRELVAQRWDRPISRAGISSAAGESRAHDGA
ncbi:MAG: GNAT family N-acetyltransferase [Pseudomonadota bacterium]